MRTLEELLRSRLQSLPYLADALQDGFINYSALARSWKAWLSALEYKDASVGAISMALRRIVQHGSLPRRAEPAFFVRTIVLQPHLFEMVFAHSSRALSLYDELLQERRRLKDDHLFLHCSQGLKEVMIIAGDALHAPLQKLSKGERLLKDLRNVSGITMLFSDGTEAASGIYYPFIRALAWEGIRIVEILSTWSQLTFIVREEDAERTLSILQRLTR